MSTEDLRMQIEAVLIVSGDSKSRAEEQVAKLSDETVRKLAAKSDDEIDAFLLG